MAGNGYFDKGIGRYYPKSVETWDDYDASSAGVDWDGISNWEGTPVLPLTFTTDPVDFGESRVINYLVQVETNYPVNITVEYGESIDSAGGSIDGATSIAVTPNDTSLSAVKARYFQFTASIDQDSAGNTAGTPYIQSIVSNLKSEKTRASLTDIDSSTLSGSVGVRSAPVGGGISAITSLVCQPHLPSSDPYVADSYVSADYFESAVPATPYIFIDKTTTPPTLYIYDIDAFGKRKAVDCVFDAMAEGLRAIQSDANGNIVEV